jgi:hypothetical protein
MLYYYVVRLVAVSRFVIDVIGGFGQVSDLTKEKPYNI